ncbi:N-acetyl-1-D-myo-inositol-2-amino-2-deoxy-alpha-D-glucopyranoside deacetylase [Corynebacterium pseudogenitalium]|uniref:N-acetyl-1-D-myo-inositol-2-amino-2-deoxy-alpha- D-glucopyranoside deacetylase n=1 Tax=Corynebacterium pseudogenitalium TaxID=38303 RepID=UPI00272DDFA1|nr:N-acetyl-1-D-myo-inositol-2-amino-2-deoxy-alpha-D-glucopyranoside deacetylase [Corynebacterium pseudogenitalium]MCQ4607108.1 N-acetyl-1-D-myo-inositol-2-amino-2-deoxy-alpha-D-glucopyranoside deacetylase [Corynebacterium pseudogenitalium]
MHNSRDLQGYRVLAVHAHPDDESITMAGTLFDLARRGADVLVVTCTLGEEGEVIGEPYQLLTNDHGDQLGGFRIAELHGALQAIGVRGEFLGGAGCFRDSGMAGSEASKNPRAFVNSGRRAVDALLEVLRRERPHLVLTYGPDGGYGHPDHIRAHEIVYEAAEEFDIPRILWAVRKREETDALLPEVAPEGWRLPKPGELDGVDSVDVSVRLDGEAYSAKIAAMAAHATQIWVADGRTSATNPHAVLGKGPVMYYALSNLIVQPIQAWEHFQLGGGEAVVDTSDVLSGLER